MHVPVIISGAGPTGLTLAHELARQGIEYHIIDRKAGPVTTSNALAVHAKTLEIWQDMGFAEQAVSLGHPIRKMNLYNPQHPLGKLDFSGLDTAFPFVLALPQSETEAFLIEHIQKQGGQILWETQTLGCQSNPNGVEITTQDKNGTKKTLQADWFVICEGCHSPSREALQIPFQGTDFDERFFLVDLPIEWGLSNDEGHIFFSPNGVMAAIPLKEYTRLILDVSQEEALSRLTHPKFEQFKGLIHDRFPYPIELGTPLWTSAFRVHQRRVPQYQYNRVLLAGDSAHVHSPVGGQGMNLGIQDAYNLAWKLSFALQKKGTHALLHSYTEERLPQAKSILQGTGWFTKLITLKNGFLRWCRDTTIQNLCALESAKQKLANELAGLSQKYTQGMFYFDKTHACIGERLMDADLFLKEEKIKLKQIVSPDKFSLIFFFGNMPQEASWQTEIEQLNQLIASQKNSIQMIGISGNWHDTRHKPVSFPLYFDKNGQLQKRLEIKKPSILLVRPDQYIAVCEPLSSLDSVAEWIEHFLKKSPEQKVA